MYGREHHSILKQLSSNLKKSHPPKAILQKKKTGLSYALCAEKQWLLSLGVEDGKLRTDWEVSPLHIRLRDQEEMSVEVELS